MGYMRNSNNENSFGFDIDLANEVGERRMGVEF